MAERERDASHSQFDYSASDTHLSATHTSKFQRILDAVSNSALSSQEEVRVMSAENAEERGEAEAVVPTQLDHEQAEDVHTATQVDSQGVDGFAAEGELGSFPGNPPKDTRASQEAAAPSASQENIARAKPSSQASSHFESRFCDGKHLSMQVSVEVVASPTKFIHSPQSAKHTQSDDVTQLPAHLASPLKLEQITEAEILSAPQTQFDLHLAFNPQQQQRDDEQTQFSLHVDASGGEVDHEKSGGDNSDEESDDGIVQTQFDLFLDESEGVTAATSPEKEVVPAKHSNALESEIESSAVKLQFSADTEPATASSCDASSSWKQRRVVAAPQPESSVDSGHVNSPEGRSIWASLVRRPDVSTSNGEDGMLSQKSFTSKRRKKSVSSHTAAESTERGAIQLDATGPNDEHVDENDSDMAQQALRQRGSESSDAEESEWVDEDAQGITEELDEHDIPKALHSEELASMTPAQLWRVLNQHGWLYKRGKDLVDWYYIRPGRDTTPEYVEGVDYFQADQMLEYAQIHVLSRESEHQVEASVGDDAGQELDDTSDAASEELQSLVDLHSSELEENENSNHQHPLAAKKRSRPASNRPSEFAGADTMRFAELWEKLKRLGWTSVYGSGLVERYYLCPGVDKHAGTVGVDMFASEDQVREFVCREILGEEILMSADYAEGGKRRRRPSRTLRAAALHEELSSDDDAAIEQFSAPTQEKNRPTKGQATAQWNSTSASTSTSTSKQPKRQKLHTSRGNTRINDDEKLDVTGSDENDDDDDYDEVDGSMSSASAALRDFTPNTKRQKFAEGQFDVVLHMSDKLPTWAARMARAPSDVTPGSAAHPISPSSGRHAISRSSTLKAVGGAVTPSKRTPPSLQRLLSSRTSDDGVRLARGNRSKMFEGMRFLMTGLSAGKDRAFSTAAISELVKQHSGAVISLADVKQPFQNIVVVAHPTAYRKLSFLWALSTGCALVHPSWVSDSVRKGILQELDQYQLPFGISHDSEMFLFRKPYAPDQRNVFKGLRIAHTIEPKATWDKILEAAGANIVPLPQEDDALASTMDFLLRPDIVIMDPLRLPPRLPQLLRQNLQREAQQRKVPQARFASPLVLSVDWLAACLGPSTFVEPDNVHSFRIRLELGEELPAVKDGSGERFVAGDFVTYLRSSESGSTSTGRLVQLIQRGDLALGKIKQYRRTNNDTLVATNIVDVVPIQCFQTKVVVVAAEAFAQVAYASREPAVCKLAALKAAERQHYDNADGDDQPVDEEDY